MTDVWQPELIVKQPRISSLQLAILRRLQERGPSTPYSLGASIGTLKSLERRNLVVAFARLSEPEPILWRITEEGYQLIQSKEQGE